jgi:hypothetical protein
MFATFDGMSSVLAIVSKAVFEKMVPKDVRLGTVVSTDRYVSSQKAFESLGGDDAIFLVTVRPPDEKLWLVGILESPKRKGDAWVSAKNVTSLTDITSAIGSLKFATGTGITAKKGALGMSLQTPRLLTDDDVTLLRGLAGGETKPSLNDVYMRAVEQVVTKHKTPSSLGRFRLENVRTPLKGKPKLEKWEQAQVTGVLGDPKELDSDMKQLQVTDVVDTHSGEVLYQLMLWPYGDGAIVKNRSKEVVCGICQHGLDGEEELGKVWVRDLARAWVEGAKRLKLSAGHIDFSAEELGEAPDADDGVG